MPKIYQRKTEFYEIKTASYNSLWIDDLWESKKWSEVELIFNHCAKELEKEEWEAPERISLDEFSNLKGHKDFITTVVDLDKKILLDVIKGHKQEELMEALKAQPPSSSGESERSERRYVVRIYSSDQGIISQC